MACLEVKGLPTTTADDGVVKTKLLKYFQIKRLSGGGECEPPELLPGGRARLRFKQQDVLERVLKQQNHVLEINEQKYVLEVSRSGEEVEESSLGAGGTTPTQVTGQDTGKPDATNGENPVKPVTATFEGGVMLHEMVSPPANDDLMQLELQQAEEETNEIIPSPRQLTSRRLSEAFLHLEAAMDIFRMDDPIRERSSRVNRTITSGIHCYKELYQEKNKNAIQLSLDKFLKRSAIIAEGPQKSPEDSQLCPVNNPDAAASSHEEPLVEPVVQVLESDPRRVLLRGFTRPVERDVIDLYVESCSGTDEFSINYTDDDSCRVVSFSSDIEIQAFIGRCGQRHISSLRINAEQLPLASSVMLEDLPENISLDYLELYLESRGGAAVKVKEVTFGAGDSTALVHLQSNEDVEKMLKSQLRLRGKIFTAHRYYETHGLALFSWDEENFKVPEPQLLPVDPVLMDFITARPEQSQQLREFLKEHLATVQWPSGATKDVMKVTPDFAENKKANFMFKSKWSKSISKAFQCFFDKYMHHSEVINKNIFDELLAKLSTDQQDSVQIIPDKQQSKISIIGQKDEVESVIENLSGTRNNIFSEQERIKKLRRGEVSVKQAHVHLMTNFKKRLQRDFPDVAFHVDVKKRLIAVEGPKDDSLAAESKILQMMLQCSEKPWIITDDLKAYVLQLNRDTFIKNTFGQKGIEASISERGNDIMIVSASEDDLSKAEDLLNMTLVEVKVKGIKGFDMNENVKEWETFQEELKASQEFSEIGTDPKFQMKCTSGNEILICGYRDVIQNVAKQVEELMDSNASLEFFIALNSRGVVQYLNTYGDMQEWLPKGTKIQTDEKRNGFTVITKTKDKEEVMERIGDMSKSIVCQERVIKKPGCARFLHERGKIFLHALETSNKCIILIDQPRDQQKTEFQKDVKDYVAYRASLHGITVLVLQGEIQCQRVDVVVNAANEKLQHIGGLAKDLQERGGQDIQNESDLAVTRNGGPFQEGAVVLTGAGSLPCKAVIHAVGPRWDHTLNKRRLLNKAVTKSIMLAAKHNYTSIAIPAISSGYFGFPLPLCCNIITTAVQEFCEYHAQHPTSIRSIHLINNDSITVKEMQEALKNTLEQEDHTAFRTTRSFELEKQDRSERQDRRHVKKEAQSPLQQGKEATARLPPFKKTTQPSNTNEYHTQEGLKIHLVKGNMEREEVDVIVNTIANDLDLSRGAVSAALLRKAGSKLQELTNDRARGGTVAAGGILGVKTQGCNLACREVYHTVCCNWKEGSGAEQILRQIVSTCLQRAQASKHQSISFPAIGTGNLGFPKPITAKIMFDTFVGFSKQNPKSIIQHVRLVVYGKDEATFTAFHNELQTRRTTAENESRGATGAEDARKERRSGEEFKGRGREDEFEVNDTGESDASSSLTKQPEGNDGFYSGLRETGLGSLQMKFGKVVVMVEKGNIVKEATDAIVNSTDENFSQGRGVSAAIMKEAGPLVQRALEKQDFLDGVSVTGPGNLPCKQIVHIAINNPRDDLSQVMFSALVQCENLNITSISVPALGTGVGGLSPRASASAILDAVAEFSVHKRPKKLRCVKIIIFNVEMLKDFHNELQCRLKKHGPQEKGLYSIMTRGYKAIKSLFGGESEGQEQANQTAQANIGIKPVHIQVYSTSAEINRQVLDEIDEKLTVDGCEKKIRDEIIADFGADEREAIQLLQDKNQVLIDFIAKDIIRVEGNISDVSQVLIEVHAMMNDVRKRRDRSLQEDLLAQSVQWMFLLDEQYISFPPKYNAMIEESSKTNQCDVVIKEDENRGVVYIKDKIFKTEDGNDLPIKRKKAEDIIPVEWVDVNDMDQERFCAVPLKPTSNVYKNIEQDFTRSLGNLSQQPGFEIEEITHIQNPSLWKLYVTKQKEMEKANKPNAPLNERILFHGTASATCNTVNTNGFNRSYCGKNATCYGKGVYFAVSAHYSAQATYSPPDPNGSKYMYRVRVLTGEFTVGKDGMIEPPPKSQQNSVLYDSVTDNMKDPVMFVVFNDNQAYPEYLIKFKL